MSEALPPASAPAEVPAVENPPPAAQACDPLRALTELSRHHLIADTAHLPAPVRAYQQARPHWFADPKSVLRDWQVGYLPGSAPIPATLAALRDRIVFPIRSAAGQVVAYCARDPALEEKHQLWAALPAEEREETLPPLKWAVVPDDPRSGALYGQERLARRGVKAKLKKAGGLFVVEGPGDVIRLARADIVALGLLGTNASHAQVRTITDLAREHADGRTVAMLDLDTQGRCAMLRLVQQLCTNVSVRVAWTSQHFGGRFAGRKPSSLSDEEISLLLEHLTGRESRSEREPS